MDRRIRWMIYAAGLGLFASGIGAGLTSRPYNVLCGMVAGGLLFFIYRNVQEEPLPVYQGARPPEPGVAMKIRLGPELAEIEQSLKAFHESQDLYCPHGRVRFTLVNGMIWDALVLALAELDSNHLALECFDKESRCVFNLVYALDMRTGQALLKSRE